jgi:hypothetical protein
MKLINEEGGRLQLQAAKTRIKRSNIKHNKILPMKNSTILGNNKILPKNISTQVSKY